MRSYEAKDGGRRWITEIVANSVKFLERRGSQQNANSLPTYDEEGNELRKCLSSENDRRRVHGIPRKDR